MRAGWSKDQAMVFRSLSSQQVQDGTYRGYLGRITVAANSTATSIYVADKDRFAGVGVAPVTTSK
jgi:hypothetical protein